MSGDGDFTLRLDPVVLLAACCVAHLAAAAYMYHRLVPVLAGTLRAASNPAHLLGMARGLRRFLALDLFVPPMVPLLSAALVAFASGVAGQSAPGASWIALGLVPPAVESLARAATVAVAPTPATVADLLSLPDRFSSGALPLFTWLGTELSRGTRYWAGTITLSMGCSVYCWARALALSPMVRALQPSPGSGAEGAASAGMAALAVGGLYIVVAAAVQLTTPAVVQLVLMATG